MITIGKPYITTENDTAYLRAPVKISEDKIAYISIPDCLDLEEIKALEQYVEQICEHYITKE